MFHGARAFDDALAALESVPPPSRPAANLPRMTRSLPLVFLLAAATLVACDRSTPRADSTTARDTATVAPADGVTQATAADSGCAPAPLADSAAGPVRLGMRADEIAARCAGTRDSSGTQEGTPTHTLVVPVGAELVHASIVDGRAWRLAVVTPGLRTRDSLGVGTPLSRLLALPGARGLTGEGSTYVVADRPCGLSFELDAFVPRAEPDTAALHRLAGKGAKVKRVLVTGCATAP